MVVGWVVGRIVMHRGRPLEAGIAATELDELTDAMYAFGTRPDVAVFYGSADDYQRHLQARLLWVRQVAHLLYHRGQLDTTPTDEPASQRRAGRIARMIASSIASCRPRVDRPAGDAGQLEIALRRFVTFLATPPRDRDLRRRQPRPCDRLAQSLQTEPTARTGRPLSVAARRGLLSRC